MSLQDINNQIKADNKKTVMIDTWGHLAPKKNVRYPIQLTVAVGFFDALNPIALAVSPEDGPWDGPWFYDAVNDFISGAVGKDENSGELFTFVGHWRNYKFVGKWQKGIVK